MKRQGRHRPLGQMLIAGFEGNRLPGALKGLLENEALGGVILFSRNLENTEQVTALNQAVQRSAALPPFISIDQEGGRVARLGRPLTLIPDMAELGKLDSVSMARRVGNILGLELSALGFNLNFAPVLDVDSNPANPIIGKRAFGPEPRRVARLGIALSQGMEACGVMSSGKHFPGHGDTSQDSHLTLPRVSHDRERLEQVELLPFAEAARAGISSIMTAHILFDRLDPDHPATLSPTIIRDLLRRELGYEGIVISDDLEMKAISERYEIEEVIERGVAAGVDLFLVCHTYDLQCRALEMLDHCYESSEAARKSIECSLSRIARAKRCFPPSTPLAPDTLRSLLGRPAHLKIAEEIHE